MNLMKEDSLLSQLSNLSRLSNVSYRGPAPNFNNSQILKDSGIAGHGQNLSASTGVPKQEQIGIDSLGLSNFKNIPQQKQMLGAFSFWTKELHENMQGNIQGTSDNEPQQDHIDGVKMDDINGVKMDDINGDKTGKINGDNINPINGDNINQINGMKIDHIKDVVIKEEQEQNGNYWNRGSGDSHRNMKMTISINTNTINSNKVDENSNKVEENKSSHYQCQEKVKNETKNIPKNFGKAIIIFIEKNEKLVEGVTRQHGIRYRDLVHSLRGLKKKINTIADLRNLWGDTEEGRCIRVVSNYFLRKHSLHYIYNSRIKTRICHSKYKRRLQEALTSPYEFNHIKEY